MSISNLFSDSGKVKPVVYSLYWLGYVLLFSVIQGWGAENHSTVFYNELLSLLPRILFVYLVLEWLIDEFLLKDKPALFFVVYITLILFFAFFLRVIDNYIILKYFLKEWGKEPLFSIPPFLYNAIKLQFVVTAPFAFKLFYFWQKEKGRLQYIQSEQLEAKKDQGNLVESMTKAEERVFISIKSQRKVVKVYLDEIHYLEAQRNCLVIYTRDEVYRTYQSISDMEEKLPADQFMRIHRSFIISLNKVKAHTSSLVFVLNHEIPIGRAYSSSIDHILRKI
ncbi:MAG: LytTR family transcriptional regulator [Sphingobacteriales bacterium]|nr:LytTR family transcriptional regulator [Sphingobacteriales bacterium]